jgi:IS30 family transposase
MHPEDPAQRGSHETIYAALYASPRGELRKALLGAAARPGRAPGHWEGDLIKGAGNRSAVGVLMERKNRYGVVGPEARQRGPRRRWKRSHGSSGACRPCVRKTLTYDRGKAKARPQDLARRLRIRVYFADPHSPWQRPSNENANGLIRRVCCPRAGISQGVSQAELKALAKLFDNRPRKCLDFETPGYPIMQLLMRDRAKLIDSAIPSCRVQVALAKRISYVV